MPEVTDVINGEAKTRHTSDARTLALNPKIKEKIKEVLSEKQSQDIVKEREKGTVAPLPPDGFADPGPYPLEGSAMLTILRFLSTP